MSVAWVGAGIAAVGVASQHQSAQDAENAQKNAGSQSDATQRYFYDTNRADNEPFLNNGTAASNALAYRLGLSSSPNLSAASPSTYKPLTSGDLIDTSGGEWKPNADLYASDPKYKAAWDQFSEWHKAKYGVNPGNARGSDAAVGAAQLQGFGFDLDAANQARTQANQTATAQVEAQQPANGLQGSLLRQFTADDLRNDPVLNADASYLTPMHDFGQEDLNKDLVYQNGLQFGLDQGNKGIERQAAASGAQLSGATLKALARYGTDYATTKTGDAYARFTNNQNAKYAQRNDSFNRFNTNQTNVYNKLAGLAGSGQTASSQVGAAGQNAGNNISASQIGVGNARGASAIAQGNALTEGLSRGYSGYQNNRLLDSIQNGNNYNSWAGSNSGLGMSNYDLGSAF